MRKIDYVRRGVLVRKVFSRGLTAAETRELSRLDAKIDREELANLAPDLERLEQIVRMHEHLAAQIARAKRDLGLGAP